MPRMKPKVTHVITMLELGGAQGNTLFTVEHLSREKFDVGLISGPGGIQDPKAKQIKNLDLRFVPSLVRPVRPWKDLACYFDLKRLFKEKKPDIVHTHSSKAGILGRLAARSAGVPIIIHSIHGFGFNPYQKFYVRWLFVFLEKIIAPFTTTLIAVAQSNIDEGIKLGIGEREQYVLIRSGVDIQKIRERANQAGREALRRELGIEFHQKMILSIGPFKFQKDPVAFVEIAAHVRKQIPEAVFVWSGDGELRPQVEKRMEELGIKGGVKILGWRRDIPELLAACDIFVLTSLWEGLPRSGVEALIAGKPVVAFAVDGVPEIIQEGKNGFILKPGDKEGFARRLIETLKDGALAERLAQAAAQSIDASFDIHGMVRSQEALYDKLLARSRSR